MGYKSDLSGERFGRLTAVEYSHTGKDRHSYWICKCDCGNEVAVSSNALKRGGVRSCGCLQRESIIARDLKHGKCHTRIYRIWSCMKTRCYNPNFRYYGRYGGRGIKICDDWIGDSGFQNFYDWAISHGYGENLEIDRINNDGSYEPLNCRWATRTEQANNTHGNHIVSYMGKEYTISQLSLKLGISSRLLWHRIASGWAESELSKPSRKLKQSPVSYKEAGTNA